MIQILSPNLRANVLEIGTGSGYQTAILSKLFKRVYTIERYKELFKKAKEIITILKIKNIVSLYGDGTKGWPAKFTFDRIILSAVSEKIPKKLVSQLSDKGVLVLPLKDYSGQHITKIVKENNKLKITKHWKVKFVPLLSGIK